MQVEPSLTRQRNGTRLLIRNIPQHVNMEMLREMLDSCGVVKEVAQAQEGTISVTYAAPEQAQQAKEKFDDAEFQGSRLKVEYLSRRTGGRPNMHQKQEFPLRLLVPHQFVGAIIGRSGQTIRNITQKTNARVDVVRRDNAMAAEKMVMILAAQHENCIEACKEILAVMHQEAQATTKSREPELKMLAHNNLCGRLIGKQGAVIKAIMEETKSVITVSSVNNVNHLNPDRVVTMKGSLESIGEAAEGVYGKLRAAFEADVQNMQYNPQLYYGGHVPMGGSSVGAMLPSVSCANSRNFYAPPMPFGFFGGGGMGAGCCGNNQQGSPMTCYLYIPKASVGAVIGSKGAFINYVKTESHASCQVQEKADEGDITERPVRITGHPESVWKAQWYIFDKIKMEGFTGNELAKLRCDIMVPKVMVGRIIGKGGQNVRHVQDISDAIIKLPDDQNSQAEEVAVQVIGNIYAQTLAQSLIRQLLAQAPAPGAAASPPGLPVFGANSGSSVRSRGRVIIGSHANATIRAAGDAQ